MASRLTRLAAAAAGLALIAGPAAAAADIGDWTVLDSDVGVGGDVGLDRDAPVTDLGLGDDGYVGIDRSAPVTDVTSDVPVSTTIDTDVGEIPEFEVGGDENDDIPQVGDALDVDVGRSNDLLGDVDTTPGEDIIDAPDIGEVPELGVTDREEDPIANDADIIPSRRGIEY